MSETVAVLGASSKPERYSFKAFKMLKEYGHQPVPVSPKLQELDGIKAVASLPEIKTPIDTITMYVGPETSTKMKTEILNLKPKRVIFNPGSENPELEMALEEAGIHVVEACTLVLLRTEQFDEA